MASILIVDDDAGVRELLRVVLNAAGYDVREARTGREGIRSFRCAPAELVITDIYMPDRDGLELMEALRRTHPEVEFIAVSGASGTMDYLARAQSLGRTRVLYKPFHVPHLLSIVSELLAEDTGIPRH